MSQPKQVMNMRDSGEGRRRPEEMFLEGYRENYGDCFFVGDMTRRWSFGLRHNHLSGFSRMGDGTLLLLRFGHVAGFVSVPRPAAGLKTRPPGGGRKSDHANQQEHNASHKNAPVRGDDSLHAFVGMSQSSPWNIQHIYNAIGLAAWQDASP